MIKVLNVISDTNIGGAGKMLITFLKNYDRNEFDMAVVLPENSLLKAEIEKIGVRCIEAANIADKSLDFAAVKALCALYEQEKPDIVHTHAAMSARIAARKYNQCKIVHTRHSVFEQAEYKKKMPYKLLAGTVNNYLSDIIIAVSPAAKTNIVETGTDPKKVQVVYNGVDAVEPLTEQERKLERSKLGLAENDFVCAIIARLEKVKGHEYVLKAAQMFKDRNNAVRILIAGTGGEEAGLKAMAEKLALDNCIFMGFVEDIRRVEGVMDVQLNASYGTEATSLSLLEGMSLGIPAVVSDFGGNPYVIQDGVNGRLYPKKDFVALFNAVNDLYGNKEEYEEMRQKSEDIFRSRFTARAMTDGIQEVYRKLAVKRETGIE